MKKIMCGLVILIALFLWSAEGRSELRRVESLTESEITQLQEARKEVASANQKLEKVKRKIEAAHGMEPVRWMEWSNEIEINGNFILLYHSDYMTQHTITTQEWGLK